MSLKKKRIIFLLTIVLVIISVLISLIIRNMNYPTNQFSITEKDSFCLSHSFNVDGKIGYEKTEFTFFEKYKILNFLASLDNEELLEAEAEPDIYGIPAELTIKRQGLQTTFLLYSTTNIVVVQTDNDRNIASRKKYTTTLDQEKEMYRLLDLPTKDLT